MKPKLQRIYVPKVGIALIFLGLFLIAVLLLKCISYTYGIMKTTGITPTTVFKLVFDSGADLKPIDGRVNILLLGIAGGTHEGVDLTDTILVLSFHQKKKTLAMISVPRDIWSDTLKDKVNSAYHYGEEKKKGGGLTLSKAVVSDVIGLPIQYALVLDFSGFEKVINLVGGIDVNVPVGFTDTEYPIAGKENDECDSDPFFRCRYETLRFDAGVQHMDGSLALKYVRSRHAQGDEGSDFARGKRQQEVILALKSKLMTKEVYLKSGEIEALYAAFDEATDMDVNIGELLTIGKMFMQTPQDHTKRISLEELLYAPPTSWYGRYVLLPKESFESLHAFVQSSL